MTVFSVAHCWILEQTPVIPGDYASPVDRNHLNDRIGLFEVLNDCSSLYLHLFVSDVLHSDGLQKVGIGTSDWEPGSLDQTSPS